MTLKKVQVDVGGVPSPDTGGADNGKALIADISGSFSWQPVTATNTTIAATNVTFTNGVGVPNNPTDAQVALEEIYKSIPATKILKFSDMGGGDSTYNGMTFLREDGIALYLGSLYNAYQGHILIGPSSWSISGGYSITRPLAFNIPEFGTKVHQVSHGRFGLMVAAGTEADPKSTVWVTGSSMGNGAAGNVAKNLVKVFTAASPTEQVTQVYANNYYSSYQAQFYVRADGKMYASGQQTHGQLGTDMPANSAPEYTFTEVPTSTDLQAGHKIVKVISSGLSTFIEVDTGGGKYSLMACGYNQVGQLGVGVTGSVDGMGNDSCKKFKKCVISSGDFNATAVGGRFKKFIISEELNGYTASVYVIDSDNKLYRSGQTVGGSGFVNKFQLVATDVVDVAASGGSDASVIFCKAAGTLHGFGSNAFGSLGNGTTTPQSAALTPLALTIPEDIVECYGVPGSNFHQFFVLGSSGTVYGAGINSWDSLGVGIHNTEVHSWTPVILPEQIQPKGVNMVLCSGTAASSYFLGLSGTVYGAGSDAYNELGGSDSFTSAAIPIALDFPSGNWPSGHWVNELLPTTQDLVP